MSKMHRTALVRFSLIVAAVLLIGGLTLAGWNWLAVTLGILSGTVFFLLGMAAGGGLGNARSFGQGPADVNTRIGVCLAACGLAAYALGHDPPFPLPFRVFYAIGLLLACVGALVLAGKGLKDSR